MGPEVIARAFAIGRLEKFCWPLVIGDARVLEKALGFCQLKLFINRIVSPNQAVSAIHDVSVIDLQNISPDQYELGKVGKESGRASVEYLLKGIDLALSGQIDALVTAPISKEAINLAGYHHPGHTEILAERTGAKDFGMMQVKGKLRIVHLSWHISLKEACALVTKANVVSAINMALVGAQQIGLTKPRIAVAGLNPHAGEAGLMGDEEEKEIAPAVAYMQQQGRQVFGPFSPDTVFMRAAGGEFDIVVAMYHDQGHIAAKMAGFEKGVNVTIGLPIIRTSVAHGTGFDIAGKGIANPGSLIAAIKLAARMARVRKS